MYGIQFLRDWKQQPGCAIDCLPIEALDQWGGGWAEENTFVLKFPVNIFVL